MDSIQLTGLEFYGYHGALSEETQLGQRFTVHLTMYLDLRRAGQADDLNETVDYAQVYESVRNIVEGPAVRLIERLAEQIAKSVLDGFPLLEEVEVVVEKPGAPIPGVFGNVSTRIRRKRIF